MPELAAKYAGLWYYHDTMMIDPVPYYIIYSASFSLWRPSSGVPTRKGINNWLASIGMGIIFGYGFSCVFTVDSDIQLMFRTTTE
ncbi:MAG: hypothetical protein MZV70_74225 [Desulfobacterales bacterium]|nr:hypothetical protein [Desulfobacterales bacterium]